MITIDFETYYDKEYSLSKCSYEEYIRDKRFQVIGVSVKKADYPEVWITGDDEYIASELKKLGMENDSVLAHNAVFDCSVLSWVYGIKPKFIFDTLSMARPIMGLSHGLSLRELAEHFGVGEKGDEVYKTVGMRREDFSAEQLEAFGNYCKKDTVLCYAIYKKLATGFPPAEAYLIDLTIRMHSEPVLELSKDMLHKRLNEVVEHKQKVLEDTGFEDRTVFMSNDKFAGLLRSYGVEPPTKVSPKTGKTAYAFAKTDLGFQSLLNHEDSDIRQLAEARLELKSTIEETRTRAFLGIAERGTLPIVLHYYGAMNTGRYSGGGGINPQNLPRGGTLRKAIKAPNGYKIIASDSSNIEARTLAWWAGQKDLVDAFAAGADVYSSFASEVYHMPVNKHDNPTERHVGKTCVLGLGYGVGHAKLQDSLHNGLVRVDLSLGECDRIVSLYRSLYSSISSVWKDCQKAIKDMYNGYDGELGTGIKLKYKGSDRTISLPSGFTLKYPKLRASEGKFGPEYSYSIKTKTGYETKRIYGGAATENIIQGLARIIVCYQMCAIKQKLDEMSAKAKDGKIRRVVHMVHDEIIVVAPEDEAEEVKKMMEAIMSRPPSWAPGLPVACEAGIGDCYGDAK